MDTARIAALLDPFLDRPLTAAQFDQISTYIDLLQYWNARINLTAIRNPDQIVTRHFGESFFLARHLFPLPPVTEPAPSASAKRVLSHEPRATSKQVAPAGWQFEARSPKLVSHVLDLGSGAGFPGLPLKIWAPHIHLALIESNHKKAAFLREVARALTLTNVNVLAERAETVAARLAPNLASAPASVGSPAHPPDSTVDPLGSQARTLGPATGPLGSQARPFSSVTGPPESASRRSDVFCRADIVTFRAVEKFDRVLSVAANFLAVDGSLALLISSDHLSRLDAGRNMKWETISVPGSHKRILAIGKSAIE